MTSAPPSPSIVSLALPALIVLAEVLPKMVIAAVVPLAFTLVKLVTVVVPDT